MAEKLIVAVSVSIIVVVLAIGCWWLLAGSVAIEMIGHAH